MRSYLCLRACLVVSAWGGGSFPLALLHAPIGRHRRSQAVIAHWAFPFVPFPYPFCYVGASFVYPDGSFIAP